MFTQKTVPRVILGLANSRRPRRPAKVRVSDYEDPLVSPESALNLLRELGIVSDEEELSFVPEEVPLEDLQALREAVERIMAALAHGDGHQQPGRGGPAAEVPADARYVFNTMAARRPWRWGVAPDLTLIETVIEGDLAGLVASLCVRELTSCDLTRLKVCERRECGLYFYDTTRNRSARWHAENPCGWRERADRRSSRLQDHPEKGPYDANTEGSGT